MEKLYKNLNSKLFICEAKNLFIYPLFLIIVILFYGNTLFNGFVHDDIWQVEQNNHIKSFQNISNIYSGCIAEDILGGCKNKGFYYRPMQTLSYLLTYQISPGAWFFHLVNLFYLLILAILVFSFLQSFFTKKIYPMLATAIFLTHPVNSEVINWVSAVPELLLAIFFMLTLIFLIKYIKAKKKVYLLLSVASFTLSIFSKETAVFLIVFFPLLQFSLSKAGFTLKSLKKYRFLLFYLAGVTIYLLIRQSVLGRIVYKYEGYYSMNTYQQVLNMLYFYPQYLLKLVFPYPLSFQQIYIPITQFDWRILISLVVILANILLVYWLYKRGLKTLFFGTLLITLPLFPALIFINKLGSFIFSERYLFISTIGFSLILADIVRYLFLKQKSHLFKGLLVVFLVLYLVFSWWKIFNRSKDWKNNFSSYQAMVRINPANKKAHFKQGNGELSFYYPKDWVLQKGKSIYLSDQNNEFHISMSPLSDSGNQSSGLYGTLLNQGLASIPNVDFANVKVWEDNGVKKLEFFLFKDNKLLRILVYPGDSILMKDFDSILATITIR